MDGLGEEIYGALEFGSGDGLFAWAVGAKKCGRTGVLTRIKGDRKNARADFVNGGPSSVFWARSVREGNYVRVVPGKLANLPAALDRGFAGWDVSARESGREYGASPKARREGVWVAGKNLSQKA